tara:strand:- start:408 stop:584 length:177 start_codon:yes stop_codon:yes gene_type:complete
MLVNMLIKGRRVVMPRHIIVMLDNICEEIQNEFPLSEERDKIFQSIGDIQDQLETLKK